MSLPIELILRDKCFILYDQIFNSYVFIICYSYYLFIVLKIIVNFEVIQIKIKILDKILKSIKTLLKIKFHIIKS
jgi:hypothetical protein